MVSPIKVSITAVDHATKIIQSVNTRIEHMQAPVKNAQRALGRFAQLSGLTRLNEGLGKIRMAATGAFRSLGQIAPVLGSIIGAASIAGMMHLATSWSNFSRTLSNNSQRLGMSTVSLQKWQGAARITGVSAQSLTGGMQNLQDGMWDAVGGRNPQLVAAFQTLGISFRHVDGSAKSAAEIMPILANKIAAIKNPSAQAAVATQFFGAAGEALLPFLRLGASGMEHYRKEAAQYGVINASGIQAANRLRESQARLTLSVEGFGYAIAQSVEPVITPMINGMANWIAQNREWIAQNIAAYVKEFANWLKSINWQEIEKKASNLINTVRYFIDTLGGIKQTAEIAVGAIALLFGIKVLSGLAKTLIAVRSIGSELSNVGNSVNGLSKSKMGGGLLKFASFAGGYGSLVFNMMNGVQRRIKRSDLEMIRKQVSPERFAELEKTVNEDEAEDDRNDPFKKFSYKLTNKLEGFFTGNYNKLIKEQRQELQSGKSWLGKNWGYYSNNTGSTDLESAKKAVAFYQSQGWTHNQALGILGNLDKESGLNPQAVGDKGNAYGIGQWHQDRQDLFKKIYGHDIHQSSLKEQLSFVNWELNNSEKSAGNQLRNATSAGQSAGIVSAYYERPAAVQAEISQRAGIANTWAKYIPDSTTSGQDGINSSASSQQANMISPTAAAPISLTAPTDNNQPLLLSIEVKNQPKGMDIHPKSKSSALQVQSVSYQRAMSPELSAGGI